MTVQDSRQRPLFDVRSFRTDPYEIGSFFWMLEVFGELIIFRDDFPETDSTLGGKPAWCPVLKSKLVLIQKKEDWSDRRAVEAVKTDLRVKAALGLGVESDSPGQATLSRHRQRMEELGLDKVYLKRFQDLLEVLELLDLDEPVCVDSVPVEGAGQVKDTYNLLGDGIRKGISALAGRSGLEPEQVAGPLGLDDYLSRSIKGRAEIDWSKSNQRREFLARLIKDAQKIRRALQDGWTPPDGEGAGPTGGAAGAPGSGGRAAPDDDGSTGTTARGEAIEQALGKVIDDDIEFDEDGRVEGIRQKPAGGRLISLVDTDMRHGRKSKSKLIAGFKAQVVATAMAGWILLIKVIQANRHDGKDLPELIERADSRGLWPAFWAGDHAYGTLDNHVLVAQLDGDDDLGPIELVARNARPPNGGRYTKDEFDIDWTERRLRCPTGQSTGMRYATRRGEVGWEFKFDGDQCAECPFRAQCISPKAKPTTGRTVFVVPEKEKVLRRHLERRQQSDYLDKQSQRFRVEQAIAHLAQCGGKEAHRFGLESVEFDVRMSALAHNLRKLGRKVRHDDQLRQRLERVVVVGADKLDGILLFLQFHCAGCGVRPPTRGAPGFAATAPELRRVTVAIRVARGCGPRLVGLSIQPAHGF